MFAVGITFAVVDVFSELEELDVLTFSLCFSKEVMSSGNVC